MEQKSRLLGLINVGFIFILASLIFRIWIIAGVVLPLIIIFFFSLSTSDTSQNLEFKRWISRDRTEENGELIYVKLMVINKGKRIPILEIVDKSPDECTIHEGSNHWMFELNKGGSITLSYAIRCHKRGRYILGPILTKSSDTFFFHSSYQEYRIFNSFAVVPSLIKLKTLPVTRYRLLPETGNIPSLMYKGRDFDFQGVRDYQEGDEMRAINWRVSAKFNTLATNEYALDQAARIFIIFDHTTSTKRVLEEGVMAALSATEYLISQRNKVGFIAIGEFVEEIPAAPGKRQLLRINEYLIDAKCSYPSHDEVFKVRLHKRLLPSIPPNSQVFFISPLYNRIMIEFLQNLARKGHEITLFLPRLEDEEEEVTTIPRATNLANALLKMDRAYVMRQVSKLGITQILWYPFGPKYEIMKVRRTK